MNFRIVPSTATGMTLGILMTIAGTACSAGRSEAGLNLCPRQIRTEISPIADEVIWGGEKPLGSAKFAEVRVECLRVNNPAIETPQVKRGAFTDYAIAVSASVNYQLSESDSILPAGTSVALEALSESKVVLQSGFSTFKPVRGGTVGMVSGRISGISDEEIQRVRVVRVGWNYRP